MICHLEVLKHCTNVRWTTVCKARRIRTHETLKQLRCKKTSMTPTWIPGRFDSPGRKGRYARYCFGKFAKTKLWPPGSGSPRGTVVHRHLLTSATRSGRQLSKFWPKRSRFRKRPWQQSKIARLSTRAKVLLQCNVYSAAKVICLPTYTSLGEEIDGTRIKLPMRSGTKHRGCVIGI